ncbi:L-lactate dehydrogenase B chain-like isoform X2 [Diachasmimorpha longicaudata]|uniref:L-lactate dehydrogenase B chain-like isoform X2 n=1 Tax=Diachasmimorpha longicaudata TaxID=58733 RepID=UPI0030B8BC21
MRRKFPLFGCLRLIVSRKSRYYGTLTKEINALRSSTRQNVDLRIQNLANFQSPACLREELLCKVSDPVRNGQDKVTIVGAGMVGVACANAILFQRISSHIAIVDAFPKKLEGEGMDYCHGSVFLDDPHIEFDTIDILSWVTWKASGLPVNRIIGTGCHLDTARFRFSIADRLGVSAKSVHGFIIGEHGDSQVPLWSGVNVAGVLFRDIISHVGLEMDEEGWNEMVKSIIKAGSTVRCLKGYSNTAVGLTAADITRDILRNSQTVKSVSTLVQGHHNICHQVFLSLPCTIGASGITQVVRMRMTEYEKKLLANCAEIIYNTQKTIETA